MLTVYVLKEITAHSTFKLKNRFYLFVGCKINHELDCVRLYNICI